MNFKRMIRLRLQIFAMVTMKNAVIGLGYLVLFTGLSTLPALNALKWEREQIVSKP